MKKLEQKQSLEYGQSLVTQAMHTVTKELKFEAAHRLVYGYPGKCQHNHGHSWVVFVTVGLRNEANPSGVLRTGLDTYGFVKDFGDFKPLKEWIDEQLDHATIVSRDDDDFRMWLERNGQRQFVVTGNPTSENLTKIIFEKAQELLEDERCRVVEVRIKETCTSEASYRVWSSR